jgi:hypothetical protein
MIKEKRKPIPYQQLLLEMFAFVEIVRELLALGTRIMVVQVGDVVLSLHFTAVVGSARIIRNWMGNKGWDVK